MLLSVAPASLSAMLEMCIGLLDAKPRAPDTNCGVRECFRCEMANFKHMLDTAGRVPLTRPSNVSPHSQVAADFDPPGEGSRAS